MRQAVLLHLWHGGWCHRCWQNRPSPGRLRNPTPSAHRVPDSPQSSGTAHLTWSWMTERSMPSDRVAR
jgi:hypothetical protein